jgi:hypothetical protein
VVVEKDGNCLRQLYGAPRNLFFLYESIMGMGIIREASFIESNNFFK